MTTVAVRPPGRRVPGRRVMLGLAAVAVATGALWWLGSSPPMWWAPPEAADPDADRRARELESNLTAEIHRIRPADERWAVSLRDADVNAWLAIRLPAWRDFDASIPWPPDAGLAQVRFKPGQVQVAIDREGTIWSAVVEPAVAADRVSCPPTHGGVGALPIPYGASLALELLQGGTEAAARGSPRTFRLGDGRTVEITDVEVRDGELLLQFVTRPRG
ncbi:MAG: hypothetical protein FGM37_04835 [Phycisphaerales bacterium]|nr:hypothetical protein [Phycisphaerales bacterium]